MVYHTVSTYAGQSGCPLIFGDSFIGIHTGGCNGTIPMNRGKLFEEQILEEFERWAKDNKGDNFTINKSRACKHLKPYKPCKNDTTIDSSGKVS